MIDDLPPGWVLTTLGDIADVQLGRQRSPQHHNGSQMRPYLRAANVTWNGISLDDVKEMNFNDNDFETYRLEPGDMLLNEASGSPNEVGKPAIWRGEIEDCCFQNTLLRLRARAVDVDYLYWFCLFSALTGRFGEAGRGVNIRHLGKQGLMRFPIAVAPRTQQQRIVAAIEEHFSRLDAADNVVASAQQKADALHRSVAVEAFDRPYWDWTTLGEIAEIKGGITKDSKREAHPEFEEFPYLRVANVQRGYLDLSEIATIRADRRKAQRLVLRLGDILFNEGGDRDKLGRGWVWEGQIENCIHQNHVFRARLLDGGFDPYFVSLHANSWGQSWFEAHGKQTTNLASLNLTTLKSFPVPAPSLQEQRSVASDLRSALDSVQHQRLELERVAVRASSLRRSILAEVFAGRLACEDPQDESADLLAAAHREA